MGFAVACYRMSKDIWHRFPALRSAGGQLFDAGGSVGANLSENDGFCSTKELAARYAIAHKESKEAKYWLRVIAACEPDLSPAAAPMLRECQELIAMTGAALKKLRPPNS